MKDIGIRWLEKIDTTASGIMVTAAVYMLPS
jgi:hypothetical protein